MKSSKSKNRMKRTSKSRETLNNPLLTLKRMINSSTNEKPDRLLMTVFEKSKRKCKKNLSNYTKSKNKSKSKNKKQKLIMKKVQVSRLAGS